LKKKKTEVIEVCVFSKWPTVEIQSCSTDFPVIHLRNNLTVSFKNAIPVTGNDELTMEKLRAELLGV
jgi:hypothetical protein